MAKQALNMETDDPFLDCERIRYALNPEDIRKTAEQLKDKFAFEASQRQLRQDRTPIKVYLKQTYNENAANWVKTTFDKVLKQQPGATYLGRTVAQIPTFSIETPPADVHIPGEPQ